jgi:hypothetical protein
MEAKLEKQPVFFCPAFQGFLHLRHRPKIRTMVAADDGSLKQLKTKSAASFALSATRAQSFSAFG